MSILTPEGDRPCFLPGFHHNRPIAGMFLNWQTQQRDRAFKN
ncbi:MAG: hypothetical protein ACLFV6_15305 [Spirulinaceae cyanobacterium]